MSIDGDYEIKKVRKPRSLKQNKYLHKLFALYSIEFGSTLAETKTDIKRALGYYYEKGGKRYLANTSEMDSKDLTDFIEKFRKLSADRGLYLPSAEEYLFNYSGFETEIDKHSDLI